MSWLAFALGFATTFPLALVAGYRLGRRITRIDATLPQWPAESDGLTR